MIKSPVVFSLFGTDGFKNNICDALHYESGGLTFHRFPDEEIMVELTHDVKDRTVVFIASTDRPNDKIMPLILAAETARELGASKVGFITPYLAYMRQDKQFHPGEGVSSKYFARLLSCYFDWIITIDAHLHRWHSLDKIFTTETRLLHATAKMAEWINKHVQRPLLIGPDKESRQWVAEIAKISQAPFLLVEKTRYGDENVSASIPQIEQYPNHTPVLIDDIISTGATLTETIKHIKACGINDIVCLAVHAIFANNAYERLLNTGVTDIVTCNTIAHPSNQIDVSSLLIDALDKIINTPSSTLDKTRI